jgi:hypothetical protein
MSYLAKLIRRKKQIEALAAIALLLLLIARWQRSWNYVYIALAILLVGLVWEDFARVLQYGWMKLAEGLGFVSSRVLLTLVFILILIPVSLFAKYTGKLHIRLKAGGSSNFIDRNHTYVKEDLENPW